LIIPKNNYYRSVGNSSGRNLPLPSAFLASDQVKVVPHFFTPPQPAQGYKSKLQNVEFGIEIFGVSLLYCYTFSLTPLYFLLYLVGLSL